MLQGLSLEYAHARLAARVAQRPDERLWAQWHAARSVPALLEHARASASAWLVSGVPWPATPNAVEAALRQVLRTRIRELAGWTPEDWQHAFLWTLHLVDLPALVHLLTDAPVPAWIAQDPQLAPWAGSTRARRLAGLTSGPLAPVAVALAGTRAAGHQTGSLHPALQAWRLAWRERWPRAASDVTATLQGLERLVALHVEQFAGVAVAEAAAWRAQLDRAMTALWHQHPAEPVGLFAALVLFALDVERIRGELAPRAAVTGGGPVLH